eukprot:m.12698 g.12698  ORF g.12698 m.12698 type:complete len:334 (-) comp4042_c0_seq1:1999-3000(-)
MIFGLTNKKKREMLAGHVSATTNVVKSISREMSAVEKTLGEQIFALSQQIHALQHNFESGHSQIGFSQVQQSHVNNQVRDAFHTLTSAQQSFQGSIRDQLRSCTERLDTLSLKMNHNISEKDAVSILGHARASSLTETQAAINVRVDNLDGKVSQVLVENRNIEQRIANIKMEMQENVLTIRSQITDIHRAMEQERDSRERMEESITALVKTQFSELEKLMEEKSKSALQANSSALSTAISSLSSRIDNVEAKCNQHCDVNTHNLGQSVEDIRVSLNASLAKQVDHVSEKISKLKRQQKEQVQTLELLADSFKSREKQIDAKFESLMRSVVIV